MLVLTRKEREWVQIGDNIKVYIVAIHGNNVQIGIEAPREIKVYRSEIIPPSDTSNQLGK